MWATVVSEPQRRGAKVVDAILVAVVGELARVGFAGLSVEVIAERAGVNKTTIYRRWPTKSDLVIAALRDKVTRTLSPPNTGSFRDDLFVMFTTVRGMLASPEGRSLFLAMLGADRSVIEIARELRETGETAPRHIIRQAIERGEIPEGIDDELLLNAIFGALEHRLIFQQTTVTDAVARRLIDIVVTGAIAVCRRDARSAAVAPRARRRRLRS
jgi:AcrR family transcriptional regulator